MARPASGGGMNEIFRSIEADHQVATVPPRFCPDHKGQMLGHLLPDIWSCPIDGGRYNQSHALTAP